MPKYVHKKKHVPDSDGRFNMHNRTEKNHTSKARLVTNLLEHPMHRCLHNLSPIIQNGSKFLQQCVLFWNTWLRTKARNQVILQI